ncbi:hypothetical protein G3M53_07975 [Streptomyces sp. SID7982]|nr:hypothetical protein [Streptomyces sp. SID7982]
MTTSFLSMFGMLAGAAVAVGVTGLVAVLRGWRPSPPRRRGPGGRWRRAVQDLPGAWRDNYRVLAAGATVAGVGVWALTGWPVHGLLVAGGIAGLPFLLYPGGSGRTDIERLEAVAEWLQQLASVRVGGKPLESAIAGGMGTVPGPIRPQVAALADRLAVGVPAQRAYRLLADDLASRIGDDISQLFIDHVTSRGPGLARALSAQATLVARQAADLRDIDAERAKARSEVRRVSLFALIVVGVVLASGSYSAPFGSALGQLGLAALGALFVVALLWLRKMSAMEAEPRTLLRAEDRTTEEKEEEVWA